MITPVYCITSLLSHPYHNKRSLNVAYRVIITDIYSQKFISASYIRSVQLLTCLCLCDSRSILCHRQWLPTTDWYLCGIGVQPVLWMYLNGSQLVALWQFERRTDAHLYFTYHLVLEIWNIEICKIVFHSLFINFFYHNKNPKQRVQGAVHII